MARRVKADKRSNQVPKHKHQGFGFGEAVSAVHFTGTASLNTSVTFS